MHQLEQLDRELDVAQPAGTELQLARRLAGGQVPDDAAAHGLHVGDEVGPPGGLPDHRAEGLEIRLAQLAVAGHRAGFQQRLELPRLGPALVVGDVTGQGPDQGAVASFGAEVGVHREQGALGGVLRAGPDQARGQLGRGTQRRWVGLGVGGVSRTGRGRVCCPGAVGLLGGGGGADEDHVHVAGVVELAPAALAHGDHRQPGGGRPRGQLGAGDGQRGLEGRGGEVGQFGRGLVDCDGAGQVPGRQVQQPPLVGGGQGGSRVPVLRPGRVGDRLRVVGLSAHRRQQVRPELGGPRAAQRVRAAQHLAVVRVADQVIAERGARAEHRGKPVPQPGVSAQRGEQVTVERHPGQRGQGQIRVGGRGE